MKIKLLRQSVKLPEKSHLPDVGLDIFLDSDIVIRPFETVTTGLGLSVLIPEGYAGILVPRSSIAEKGLIIQDSIIDPDYTGEIHLIVTNCSPTTVILKSGQRIVSLVCMSVLNARLEIVTELPKTDRNSNGLGSSGK